MGLSFGSQTHLAAILRHLHLRFSDHSYFYTPLSKLQQLASKNFPLGMADETHEVDYADSGRKSRDFGNDLKDIGQSTTEIINIDTTYQPNWGPAEGFRENYQNW